MKKDTKGIVITILIIVSMITIFFGFKKFLTKPIEKLPEVKLREKEKSFAIMIENGEKYQEYNETKWPDNDEYIFSKSECVDNNGNRVDGAVSYDNDSLILSTNKTIYCTIYFDKKYNYMQVPLHNVPAEQATADIPVYMSEKIKHVYFVDYIKLNLNESEKGNSWWDISDTTQGTPKNSVVAWVEPITNDTSYNNLYIGSTKKIRALNLASLFAAGGYYQAFESNLESIDFGNQLDTSKTTNLNFMFSDNKKLTTIKGMDNWNTSKIESMYGTFFNCNDLSNFSSLSNWDVSNVVAMNIAFCGCLNLTDLTPFANWKFNNLISLNATFQNSGITDTTPINAWNTSNVTDISGIFAFCYNLTKVDLSNWDTSSVTNVVYMFGNDSKITTIDLSNATFTQIKEEGNYKDMFLGVPTTAVLTVKDAIQKDWLQSYPKFSGTINTWS